MCIYIPTLYPVYFSWFFIAIRRDHIYSETIASSDRRRRRRRRH